MSFPWPLIFGRQSTVEPAPSADTHQRQQSDEHGRLADEVLDVELTADLAGPVRLRTRIHLGRSGTRYLYEPRGGWRRAAAAGESIGAKRCGTRETCRRGFCLLLFASVARVSPRTGELFLASW